MDSTQILETIARGRPTAPALHAPGRTSLTFADLGAQIRYVRERLDGWGIVRGDVIASVIPSRPEMAVSCAAVPAAATLAPLSPGSTTDAYFEVLERLRPKALIVPKDLDHAVRLAARRCGVAEIELVADPSAPAGMFTLELARQQESLARRGSARPEWAYVLNTSGTTGRPKLVPISHRRLASNAQSLGDWLGLTAHDVGVHLVSMHHSHGLNTALVATLLRGASVVCLPESDIDGFFPALDRYGITWVTAVNTAYRAILRHAHEFRDLVARNRLRCMRVGSGRLEPEEIDRIEATFATPLLVGFSAGEAFSITHEPLPPGVRKPGSVGVPLSNQVAIMSESGAICGAGETGEVIVRGPTVFEGYFDDPQATEAAFVNGWFRTGDLGRFDEDGYLYLVGRIKELISRGSEKISPVAIDAAITAIPGVREAATFGIPHHSLGEEVVAAVVRDGEVEIEASDIIDQVRRRMGPTRVPRKIYFVDELPRTDSGKVRRSDLPRLLGLDRDVAVPNESVVEAPVSPLETALVAVWSAVLQVDSVGVNDDFFLLGGDSLRGTRLLTSVKAVTGVDLPIESLFSDAATVAGMARAIEAVRSSAAIAERRTAGPQEARQPASIPRRQGRQAAYLSDTQRRMWFLARLDPDAATYNESRAHRLMGDVDVEALQQSVRYMARRHEILRTTYSLVDGEPRQIVHEDLAVELRCADLGAVHTIEQDEAMQRLLLGETQRAFDLAAGPPLRMLLLRLGEREHVLLRVMHHIASDGWSSGIFERELSAAYAAFAKGREPALPALPVQYADYAQWQREWLQGEVLERQLAYWKNQLSHLSPLELPTDRPRPAVASHRGAHLAVDLPKRLTEGLTALGRGERATLFMTLLAAFQVLLARYSGQEDIAVGTAIGGRQRPELEGLIGFFANTLVLRADLSGNPRFRELLARVREGALRAYTDQDLPFETLVEALAPARDLSRHPLFQAMFVLQNTPGAPLALEGLEVSRLPIDTHSAKFDLNVSIRESDAGLHARWEYASDLFDAPTIARMARHFERLLEAIVADPEQRVGELPLLSEAERHQLLVEWNDTAADYPGDRCVHQLFEAQVARTPEAMAVVYEGRRLTYAELNARANQLAHHLIARGVGPEVLVGLCVERSLDMIVGLLGILKTGGAYVPLDPSYPRERLAFMLADTQAPVLLTEHALLGQLPPFDGHVICLDRDWSQIAVQPAVDPHCPATAENLAYVIYTSGSTGRPKGILLPHRTLVNLMGWQGRGASGGRVAQFTSIGFDVSLQEIFYALLSGKTLIVVDDGTRLQPEKFAAFLEDNAITDLFLPNIVLQYLAHAAVQGQHPLPSLANVHQAGEALTITPVVQAFFEAHPACRLHNHYGPAETHVVTAETLSATPRSWPARPAIGSPISNTRVSILGRYGELVPVGATGELCIGGDGLARGYLNLPELTAEKFVRDPFSTAPGARLYRTGDLARRRPDGTLEFLGRRDDQVKIRGFRIELGEVQSVLAEHPAVQQAAVIAREDTSGDMRLVAYVVLKDGTDVDTEPLRASLRARLPDYMRPSAYVLLDRLPLVPNGKIDRRALPAPDAVDRSHPYEAPVGEIETALAQIWAEVLMLERVGRHDNFFDLGGHSLLVVTFVEALRERAGVDLPIGALFESPTPAALAERLSIEHQSAGSNETGSRGSLRLVIRPQAKAAAGGGRSSIAEILGTQREWVKRWKGSRSTPDSFIVTRNETGTRQGLFWCLQASRELTQLARHLGSDQPVHGMRSGHHVMTYTDENVDALASHYAAEMIALQPEGSFLLGGNCQGGRIAQAIALRLRELGRAVSLLVLMERGSFPPYDGPVALIFGRDSRVNPYRLDADPEAVFHRAYPAGFTVDIIEGVHGEFFQSPNVETLALALRRRLPTRPE